MPHDRQTRGSAAALAASFADDPTTVVELVHPEYNADERDGGFAFEYDAGFLTVGHDGSQRRWLFPPSLPTPNRADLLAHVEESWRQARHAHRPFGLSDVNAYHRAAIAAIVRGLDSAAYLSPDLREGLDVDVADAVMIRLRGCIEEPTQAAALRAMAARDWLVGLPGPRDRAHPCAVCGRPALDGAGSEGAVCVRCEHDARCPHGRLVIGYNQTWAGGFEARHRDDDSVCDRTSSTHAVTVDDVACLMDERRFGGTYVRRDIVQDL